MFLGLPPGRLFQPFNAAVRRLKNQTTTTRQQTHPPRSPADGDDHGDQGLRGCRRRAGAGHPVQPIGGPGPLLLRARPLHGGDAAAERDLRRRAEGGAPAADHVPRHARALPLPVLRRRRRLLRPVEAKSCISCSLHDAIHDGHLLPVPFHGLPLAQIPLLPQLRGKGG